MIDDVCSVYEAVVDIMCRGHCNPGLYRKCRALSEKDRCATKIICMKNILKPDDEEYPIELPRLK